MTRALGRLTCARRGPGRPDRPARLPDLRRRDPAALRSAPTAAAELLDASASPACPRCALLARPVGPTSTSGCSECRGKPLGFDAALALAPYQGPLRDLCLRLKHARDAWLARWLAELVAEARSGPLEAELARDPKALVVPVPLHWRRRLERGYNQAEALADALARRLGLRSSRPLRRIKRPRPASPAIGRTERRRAAPRRFRVPGPPRRPDRPARRRHPDHRRHLRRRRPGPQEGRRGSGRRRGRRPGRGAGMR